MMPLLDSWIRRLTAPAAPTAAFHLAPGYLGGLRCAPKTRSVKSSVFRTLPAGLVLPSFDKPNLAQPEELTALLKESVRRLGTPEGPVALLLPETCVKTAMLAFETMPTAPAEQEKIIRWRLAKSLPLSTNDLKLSYAVHRINGRSRAFCVLAAESVVQEYEQAFARAGLNVRMISLPTVALLGCLPKNGSLNYLIINVENEYFAVLAVLEGEPALFRVKPLTPGASWAEAAEETAVTVRYLEDREKKRVDTVWLRPAAAGDVKAGAALIQKGAACAVKILPGDAPAEVAPADKIHLAPLLGELS
ncbi:MAG: hypothetical protein ACYDH3_04025 [Candidatus Aminicenantales bacterium]